MKDRYDVELVLCSSDNDSSPHTYKYKGTYDKLSPIIQEFLELLNDKKYGPNAVIHIKTCKNGVENTWFVYRPGGVVKEYVSTVMAGPVND